MNLPRLSSSPPSPRFSLTCTRCGQTVETASDGWMEASSALVKQLGFELRTARLELFGCCAACRSTGAFPQAEGRA